MSRYGTQTQALYSKKAMQSSLYEIKLAVTNPTYGVSSWHRLTTYSYIWRSDVDRWEWESGVSNQASHLPTYLPTYLLSDSKHTGRYLLTANQQHSYRWAAILVQVGWAPTSCGGSVQLMQVGEVMHAYITLINALLEGMPSGYGCCTSTSAKPTRQI